jgi:anaerobic ribonucleoside-triphosphate reductase activating protein
LKTNALTADTIRIHRFLPASRANGPGLRAVVWVQGCALGCPGCFNPESHTFDAGEVLAVSELAARILAVKAPIQGITLSGGEPFHQQRALARLLSEVRAQQNLSVLVFSGYSLDEIQRQRSANMRSANQRSANQQGSDLLEQIDVLIAGRYQAEQRVAAGLIGSANKVVHFLSTRYTPADLASVPTAEVLVSTDGEIVLSGIDPLTW